jgi:hypothetical protein
MIDSTDDDSDPLKYISNSPTDSFFFSPIDENYIAYLFSNLDIRKASLDIPNKLIKYASLELSKPFSYIYNQSIMQGVVPRGVTRALIRGGVYIHIFVFCPTNFF